MHLGLIDAEALLPAGITAVVDLGWIPAVAAAWHAASAYPGSTLPEVRIAGGLLSCVGGYPAWSGWAPAGATVELSGVAQVERAVTAQLSLGASVIKLTLNSDAGPTPSDELAAAVVASAQAHGVPVAAHAQGIGQAARALAAGATMLAHAPFSERLDDGLLLEMRRADMVWISTLDIHGWGEQTPEFSVASDNVRRFTALGGGMLYGTDLGNGPLSLGVNERELLALAAAGLSRDALVASIAGSWHPSTIGPRFAWVPGQPPGAANDAARWLATARGTTIDYLEETLV
ncbi:hypothetical protein [Luethyella okanaganae]|uniref:Amidohydrolase n=1 Tax=Luethyella okanaganae TaxID=69372 RepID=A0ABW1VHR4_9MICO